MSPSLEPLSNAALRLEAVCASDAALVLYCFGFSVGCVALAVTWALVERRERSALQRLNDKLSSACRSMSEAHYRERLNAEERHLLAFDSTVRNILESLERSLAGKPRE